MAFAGVKFGDAGSFDYGRNYGVVYDVTCSQGVKIWNAAMAMKIS